MLAKFGCPDEVVSFLNRRGPGACRVRSDVTAAIIGEAQRGESSAWVSLLMLAYFPGLLRIRATMRPSGGLDGEELNAVLIECFVEAVNVLPLQTQGRLAVLNLMLNTHKFAWRRLTGETSRAQLEERLPDAADELLEGGLPSPERLVLAREAEQLLDPIRLRAFARSVLAGESEDDISLVLDTYGRGVPLIDWMYEHHPDLTEEVLRSEYGRLRRRRSRLLERARRRMSERPVSHERFRMALIYREPRD